MSYREMLSLMILHYFHALVFERNDISASKMIRSMFTFRRLSQLKAEMLVTGDLQVWKENSTKTSIKFGCLYCAIQKGNCNFLSRFLHHHPSHCD